VSGLERLAEPPQDLRFKRRIGLWSSLREVGGARELIRTLAEREIRARYKQALLGLAWAVVTPLALMVVFTVSINRIADIQTGGAPYPLFAYLGLLPWTFFSAAVTQGGQSLVQNVPLLNKVYFPREVFPLASVTVAAIDSAVAVLALGGLFVLTGYAPRATSAWVPLLLLVQVVFTLGVTLLVSAIVVYLRDLRHALPVILQLGLFATPVAYGLDVIPTWFRGIYVTLNPLAAVIDGYRRTVLLGLSPDWSLMLPAGASGLLVLVAGYVVFKRLETGFADVA
jgi:ABC-type polysaccharide/polyol phosphate export permease